MTDGERVTYRSVLANREFAALLVSQGLSLAGDQLARITLAVVVYGRTGSAFAASATWGVSFASYLIAGPFLSTLADRFERLRLMIASDLVRAGIVILLAVSLQRGLGLVFLFIALLGLVAPAFDSARSATLPDLLANEAYVKASAIYNLSSQAVQVLGFIAGGALLVQLSADDVLSIDVASYIFSAGILMVFVRSRRVPRPEKSKGMLQDFAAGLIIVRRSAALRGLLGYALVGVMAIAVAEALAVPVALEGGGGATAGGALTAAVPLGFVVGTLGLLRIEPKRRFRLLRPFAVMSLVPLLVTPFCGTLSVVFALWVMAGVGASLQVIASAAYVSAAPESHRGRLYGVASVCLMATQGLAQFGGGTIASAVGGHRGAATAVASIAALGLLILITLVDGARHEPVRPGHDVSQGLTEPVR